MPPSSSSAQSLNEAYQLSGELIPSPPQQGSGFADGKTEILVGVGH